MRMYAEEEALAETARKRPASDQPEARTSPGTAAVALAGALIVLGGIALFAEGHELYAQGAVVLFVILVGAWRVWTHRRA
jgi:Flp pilus assembly protein TadB